MGARIKLSPSPLSVVTFASSERTLSASRRLRCIGSKIKRIFVEVVKMHGYAPPISKFSSDGLNSGRLPGSVNPATVRSGDS